MLLSHTAHLIMLLSHTAHLIMLLSHTVHLIMLLSHTALNSFNFTAIFRESDLRQASKRGELRQQNAAEEHSTAPHPTHPPCMHSMYALHVCTPYMHSMYALDVSHHLGDALVEIVLHSSNEFPNFFLLRCAAHWAMRCSLCTCGHVFILRRHTSHCPTGTLHHIATTAV